MAKVETQITEEDQKEIEIILKQTIEEIRPELETLVMAIRAIKGQPVEQTDFISGLMNLKDIRERTRFNTQIILRRQVYLRLMAKYSKSKAWEEWANEEAHALISYKGEGRQEAIDYKKAEKAAEAGMIQPGVFAGTIMEREKPPPPKKHFWNRGTKPESMEVEP